MLYFRFFTTGTRFFHQHMLLHHQCQTQQIIPQGIEYMLIKLALHWKKLEKIFIFDMQL